MIDKVFEAFKKCNEAGILIYPVPIDEYYYDNKRKLPKVKIEIAFGSKKKLGTQIYKQNEELYQKIKELYLHYVDKIS